MMQPGQKSMQGLLTLEEIERAIQNKEVAGRQGMARVWEAPNGPIETHIAAIWRETLGLDRVGRLDHFFELGGHSLAAVMVLGRVRDEVGKELTLSDLLEAPVLQEFSMRVQACPLSDRSLGANALAVSGVRSPKAEEVEVAALQQVLPPQKYKRARRIPRAPVLDQYPVTPGQKQLWVHQQAFPSSSAYHITGSFHLKPGYRIDGGLLERAVATIVQRHESLRTVFRQHRGEPVQCVLPSMTPGIRYLRGPSRAQPEIVRSFVREPFDLQLGPLVRLLHLECTDTGGRTVTWAVHHIVCDGLSLRHLSQELLLLLLNTDTDAKLPEPPEVTYVDYACWQENADEIRKAGTYWQSILQNLPPRLQLPYNRSSDASEERTGAYGVEIPADISARVNQICLNSESTPFMVFLSAFSALLGRICAQDDFLVGVPTAGRSRSTLSTVGFFANVVVFRAKVHAHMEFFELLRATRLQVLEMLRNQEYPFSKMVENVDATADLLEFPLTPVLFNLLPENISTAAFTDNNSASAFTDRRLGHWTVSEELKADFELCLYRHGQETSLAVYYKRKLFRPEVTEAIVNAYLALLRHGVEFPNCSISDLPLLTKQEERQILVEWNDTAAEYPKDQAIHQLFEEQVGKNPGAIAVVYEDEELTYAELNARANQLAHHLRGLGVGPEVLVGICAERGLETVVGLLGVLKAGGAYVPLDPSYPAERLAYMLQDASPKVLLTQERLLEQLPASDAQVLCLDRDWVRIGQSLQENPPNLTKPENLAYVIYTSGSTGQPKGVANTVLGLSNRLGWFKSRFAESLPMRVASKTSIGFVDSVTETLGALVCQGTLVIVSRQDVVDVAALARRIEESHITHLVVVPSLLAQLLRVPAQRVTSLKILITSGEYLLSNLIEEVLLKWSHVRLLNFYGSSEANGDSTFIEYGALQTQGSRSLIGHPIANTKTYILDAQLRPVPIGVAGQLHIGGLGLARGYLNQEDLTRDKFIANPFGVPGSRLYKTGDLVRYLADGNIEYLGRIDHQVKLRGFRIEPGEIESVLQQQEGVAQAVVMVREDVPGDKRLVAYVVGQEQRVLEPERLRGQLKAKLPEYMVPGEYVQLEQLPLTPNGKVDRKGLPAPSGERQLSKEYVEPRTETEKKLAEIWSQVLKVEKVGAHDNFFELGGNSLLAMRVISLMSEAVGGEIPLRLLFEHPELQALAARLEGGTAKSVSGIPVATPADDFPATSAQTQLWHHFHIYPHSSAYNLIGSIDLPGDVSIRDLHEVVNFLVARHEVLRTVFVEHDGEVRQRLLSLVEARIREHWLGQELLRDTIRAEAVVPFDLAQGPLFRVLLIHHVDGRRTLCWATHHIIFDGASLEILNRETVALFEQVCARRTLTLPPVKLQFKDFAAWQASERASKRQSGCREYWASALAGDLPGINLPFDFPVNERNHSGGAAYSCVLDVGEVRAMQALGQGEQSTLFMVLLAAWYVVMHRATDQTDLIVGAPVAGRPHADLEGTLGFFVNTIMLRAQVDPQASFSSLLREVRARVLGGMEFQDYAFDQLLQDLRIKRHPTRFPISTVFFNMWNFGAMGGPVADEHLGHREVPQEMKFDLDIYIRTTGAQQLVFDCHYRTALFKPSTIEYLLGEYRSLLRQLARAGDGPIKAFPIFETRGLPKVLANNGASIASRTSPRLIDHASSVAACFRDIARANPTGIAVETDCERHTYGELDAASDALARRLVQTAGAANGRVALLLSHGWNAIVGILSVLKAGKAYVPLDPRHPVERLQLIASDASVEAWITDAENTDLATIIAGRSLLLQLDAANTDATPAADTAPQTPLAPEAQAYLIYTSGSTGRPKGVVQTNAAVLHYLRRHTDQLSIQPGDKYAALASYSFEAGVKGILAPLLTGATVCPFDLKGATDLSSLGRFIAAVGVTIWHSVPSVYRQFLRAEAVPSNAGTSLRLVILSGDELLSTDLEQHYASRLRNVSLVNLYGLTEASLNALWKVDPDDVSPLRLGHPLGDEEVRVLKPDGMLAHVYEPGEIVIDSPFVAKGYWGDRQLSEEKFHPLDAGKTRFHTGDLGRWLPDGSLQLCGRRGDQVKLNGYRIELGEIEAAALSHPTIRAASALLSTADNGERRLVLYVESALVDVSARNALVDSLKENLRQILPDYMVPPSIALIDQLPRTPNGKVDRVALSTMKYDAPVKHVAPRNALEHALCTMVAQVLRLDSVGIDNNFFELGGHSLLAMQLISRVRETYQVDIALQELFASPTVASLARLIDIELSNRKVVVALATAADPSQNYETFEF